MLTVHISASIPQRAAISSEQLPQSCLSKISRHASSVFILEKYCSVMSMPPTVVPFMKAILLLPKHDMLASLRACLKATAPMRVVRLMGEWFFLSSFRISIISSFDSFTSPTGSSLCMDVRCSIFPIPEVSFLRDSRTEEVLFPIAETIPTPVITMSFTISYGSLLRILLSN